MFALSMIPVVNPHFVFEAGIVFFIVCGRPVSGYLDVGRLAGRVSVKGTRRMGLW